MIEPPAPLPPVPPAAGNPDIGPLADGRALVAILLPLSGPQAALGQAMLEAAQMAVLDAGAAGGRIALVPQDSGGTPAGAEAAARTAIDGGARLILGPLFSAEVQAAAGPARQRGVPVIAFTNDATVAGEGIYVMGLMPQPQVDRVVSEAAAAGSKRFAVLAPSSSYGQLAAQTAEAVAPARGAAVVGVEFYDPSGADAQETARRLSRSGADAVVLPEGPPRALSLASIYAYYESRGARARFLGTALWDDPAMWREPALYGSWFAAPPAEARAAFMERFQAITGKPAPRIATLAYDAVALAAVLARRPGGGDFSAEGITQPNGFSGVDGLFRFRRDGLPDRALAIMEIRRGTTPVTVRPAPTAFDDRPS
ncbi:MAG: penicillin-binding protein activator [Alphaproteobacteria bacterium]|nr:penicillin-binding protein activator [Alphaproteobacteria bacterium]